ncbi:hypothetical protein OC846_002391 [Tilletia horrida]|uniref:Ion transport domain-containing protein n=1 Tax=Tilletia horrida TaxID=155126 RepID=A0AAN6GRB0_9BASI|nr:hypothetical protein OC845_002596 [Tilletia horrida]KAK0553733.1 hypothetical protein OC846_002391 [Tilletia horrida]KAK0567641.1 hypothetical protein OC861_002596 [Tilletia horrida]
MPAFGKASSSSLAAARRGAAAASGPSSSDLDIPRRTSFSATLHAAAAPTAGEEHLEEDHDDLHSEDFHHTESSPLLESSGSDGIDLVKTVENLSVWPLIHWVRRVVLNTIDTALSWEELTSVDLNFAIVRPLAHKLSRLKSIAIVYVLLLNKIQFANDSEKDLAYQQVNATRAMLCELLAIKMLRTFSREGIELVTALTAPFSPFAGAEEGVVSELFPALASSSASLPRKVGIVAMRPRVDNKYRGGLASLNANTKSSALELAILGRATKFLASPLARRCVDGIWTGRVVISSYASHAIIDDSYKKRPLSIYDPSKAPVLDHYRLRVPLIRSRLEFLNFIILWVLFLIALQQRGTPHWTIPETFFTIWLAGFTLDEFAQLQEHGGGVYFSSLDNGLDALFILISSFFMGFRISGLRHGDFARQELAFDILALGAVVLCPRAASIFVADSVVLLSLKAMLADFVFFMSLAMVCFSGFWFAFWSLVEDRDTWTPGNILWTMLRITFFAGYVDLSTAKDFSPIFGPPLFVIFAVVSNVLLLTILISSLSNTFTVVAMRADEEVAYQHACRSVAGISSDALFSYIPPLNLIGFAVILPCKFFLTERYLHKTHVFLVRAVSFPILLTIRMLERQAFKHGLELTAERGRRAFSWVPVIGSSRSREERQLLDIIFSIEPPDVIADADAVGATLPKGGAASSAASFAASSAASDDHQEQPGNDEAREGDDFLEGVMSDVVKESKERSELISTIKEQAKGDVEAAQALEGEDARDDTDPSSSERRRSQYGTHLTASGPQPGSPVQSNVLSSSAGPQAASRSQAPATGPARNYSQRSRARASTISATGVATPDLAPSPGPGSPPSRGLGVRTSPLARIFGGKAPTSRRASRGSAEPIINEIALPSQFTQATTAEQGGTVSGPSQTPAGNNFAMGTFGAGALNAGSVPAAAAHHHPPQESAATKALLKRIDKLEKHNETMLELLRSLVAASATKD